MDINSYKALNYQLYIIYLNYIKIIIYKKYDKNVFIYQNFPLLKFLETYYNNLGYF
jgi:hypothetical protein